MRHFVSGAYHVAAHVPENSTANYLQYQELPEGDDGKCDWCRAADAKREKRIAELRAAE